MRAIRWWLLPLLVFFMVSLQGTRAGGHAGESPTLLAPNGIVPLSDGSLLISDIESHRIFHWDVSGRLTFWGGTGQPNFAGDGQHVSHAAFNAPCDLKLDPIHNAVLIADSNNHRIRRVDLRTLTITTVAGNGRSEFAGDGGDATLASLNNPQGLALDPLGNVLIADTYNHVVRRMGTDGIITTVGGSEAGLAGDGGPATSAQLSLPMAVAFGNDGRTFYISDGGNGRIRKVSPEGVIQTVCGIGKGSDDAGVGFSGDGELATKAKMFSALDLVIVAPNFLYFSDSGNHRIRSIAHGVVFSVAGAGHPGGTAIAEKSSSTNTLPEALVKSEAMSTLSVPAKMAIAPDGGLYFCDRGNRAIRLLTKDGKIETLWIAKESENSR